MVGLEVSFYQIFGYKLSHLTTFFVMNLFGLKSGGPGQMAHLAPTYAAVNALCILGTNEAYIAIDR